MILVSFQLLFEKHNEFSAYSSLYLCVAGHQFSPFLPLRTLVSVGEGGLIGRPAALLMTVPERRQTHPFLEIRHPINSQIDDSGQRACVRRDRDVAYKGL